MKKFAVLLVVALVAATLCFSLVACNNYTGEYVYDNIEVTGSIDNQAAIDFYKPMFEKIVYKFEKDDKMAASIDNGETWFEGTYKVENKVVKIFDADGKETSEGEAKFSGKKLIFTSTEGEITLVVTYVKK